MRPKDHTEILFKRRLGIVLKKARVEAGFTQKKLAEKVCIRSAYLSHIETGRRSASLGLLTKLASALDTQASRLMLEAELQTGGGEKGKLIFLLIKCLEQSPDIGELLSSLKKFAANTSDRG